MRDEYVRPPFWKRHPWLTVAAAVIVGWQLWQGWTIPVAIMVTAGLLIWIRRRRRALALREAALRARADFEHRLTMAGDPRGIYGRYPPVQPGWFRDPVFPQWIRYFDGTLWTGYVARR